MTFQHSLIPNLNIEECVGVCKFSFGGHVTEFSIIKSEYLSLVEFVERMRHADCKQAQHFPDTEHVPDDYLVIYEGKSTHI